MMCTSVASSMKGEQQQVPSKGKQEKPLHMWAIIGNTWERWTGQTNPKAIWYCTEEWGLCKAWEFIYFTARNVETLVCSKSCNWEGSSHFGLEGCAQMAEAGEGALGWRAWHAAEASWSPAWLWALTFIKHLQLVYAPAALSWGTGSDIAVLQQCYWCTLGHLCFHLFWSMDLSLLPLNFLSV